MNVVMIYNHNLDKMNEVQEEYLRVEKEWALV